MRFHQDAWSSAVWAYGTPAAAFALFNEHAEVLLQGDSGYKAHVRQLTAGCGGMQIESPLSSCAPCWHQKPCPSDNHHPPLSVHLGPEQKMSSSQKHRGPG